VASAGGGVCLAWTCDSYGYHGVDAAGACQVVFCETAAGVSGDRSVESER
jgi:hypothetical protein